MKVSVVISSLLMFLVIMYLRNSNKELFPDQNKYPYNYPGGLFISTTTDDGFNYAPSILYPRRMIPKDLRCDPVLDCQQKVKDEDGTLVTLPPMRTKCLGDRVSICKPIKDVKSYPLSPSI